MALPKIYSRAAFEQHSDADTLCAELGAALTQRLRGATDRASEAHAILDDLRAIGHKLWSWDESCDFMICGDDYMRPGPTRFIVTLNWEEDDEPEPDTPESPFVSVDFGPWPTPAKESGSGLAAD